MFQWLARPLMWLNQRSQQPTLEYCNYYKNTPDRAHTAKSCQPGSYAYAIHVCHSCVPFMYAIHVCYSSMLFMYATHVCYSSMLFIYACMQ
jgi:hypothetical protein